MFAHFLAWLHNVSHRSSFFFSSTLFCCCCFIKLSRGNGPLLFMIIFQHGIMNLFTTCSVYFLFLFVFLAIDFLSKSLPCVFSYTFLFWPHEKKLRTFFWKSSHNNTLESPWTLCEFSHGHIYPGEFVFSPYFSFKTLSHSKFSLALTLTWRKLFSQPFLMRKGETEYEIQLLFA